MKRIILKITTLIIVTVLEITITDEYPSTSVYGMDDPKLCKSRNRANYIYLAPGNSVTVKSHKHGKKSTFHKVLLQVLGRSKKRECSLEIAPHFNYKNIELTARLQEYSPSCDATLTLSQTDKRNAHPHNSKMADLSCGSTPASSYTTEKDKNLVITLRKSDKFTDFHFQLKIIAYKDDSVTGIGLKIGIGVGTLVGFIIVVLMAYHLLSQVKLNLSKDGDSEHLERKRRYRQMRQNRRRTMTKLRLPTIHSNETSRNSVREDTNSSTEQETRFIENRQNRLNEAAESIVQPPPPYDEALRMQIG